MATILTGTSGKASDAVNKIVMTVESVKVGKDSLSAVESKFPRSTIEFLKFSINLKP